MLKEDILVSHLSDNELTNILITHMLVAINKAEDNDDDTEENKAKYKTLRGVAINSAYRLREYGAK